MHPPAPSAAALIQLTPADLITLLQGAGGGLANGNQVLSQSLAAQSELITVQTEQMKALVAEIVSCAQKLGEHERSSLDKIVQRERAQIELKQWEVWQENQQRQWEMRMGFAQQTAARESATQAEMLNLAKTAAVGLLAVKNPELGATLAAVMAGMSPGTTAKASGSSGAGTSERTLGPIAQAAQMVVSRLSPETLVAILGAAEQPNPKLPNKVPTLAFIAHLLFTSLDAETLERVKTEVGPELFTQIANAVGVQV
jgi:hypothetical protein